MLLYLNSWTEKDFPDNLRRSWKSHDFDVLDEPQEEGLVGSHVGTDAVTAQKDKEYGEVI